MDKEEISEAIISAAIEVHRTLGPGLLESVYEEALAYELRLSGWQVERQVPIAVNYKTIHFEMGFKADLNRSRRRCCGTKIGGKIQQCPL